MERFHCKTKIITGAGSIAALKEENIGRLMLICDPFFYENGTGQAVLDAAGKPEHQFFSEIVPDPSVTLAAKGAAAVKAFQPDTVVALGGGSTMDTAKAMVYFSGMGAKLIAIPTTSGSGSEVTDFAILTHEGVKHPLVDDKLKPDIAILDSDFVASLPPALVADGGFDLISHALEAYVATGRSRLSNLLAADAFRVAVNQLPASFEGDVSVRGAVHTAATMAGIAFSQAGLGLCHALAHSIGGEFHLPHGRLNALLLPAVVECNGAVCGPLYGQLAREAGLSGGSDAMALRALKNTLLRLRRNLRLPENLCQAGLSPAELQKKRDALVAATLNDPCCKTNPIPVSEAMVRGILTEVTGRG